MTRARFPLFRPPECPCRRDARRKMTLMPRPSIGRGQCQMLTRRLRAIAVLGFAALQLRPAFIASYRASCSAYRKFEFTQFNIAGYLVAPTIPFFIFANLSSPLAPQPYFTAIERYISFLGFRDYFSVYASAKPSRWRVRISPTSPL